MNIGLLVNPVAGVGGPAGLKGSDGVAAAGLAQQAGAMDALASRMATMFEALGPAARDACWITAAGAMGERWLSGAGLRAHLLLPVGHPTLAADTRRSAAALALIGVDVLVFAGGDGTARDVHDGLAEAGVTGSQAVLGMPSGVKMQSAVFASSPTAAGLLLRQSCETGLWRCHEAEVMDIDERALRDGVVAPRLYGYLRVPDDRRLTQGGKARHAAGEAAQRQAIAAAFAAQMEAAAMYAVCGGSTTFSLKTALGISGTLLGVDLVMGDGTLLARDASRDVLERLVRASDAPLHIVASPIGGQGYVVGRGNQQVSPLLLRRAGRARLHVLASAAKLASLRGRPMLVDSGDPALDRELAGFLAVTSGDRDRVIWPIAAA